MFGASAHITSASQTFVTAKLGGSDHGIHGIMKLIHMKKSNRNKAAAAAAPTTITTAIHLHTWIQRDRQ